ncbi:hypothetical protein [Leucobacter ruminantium]|uniref:Transcriptional regulator, AbiEi antitoxin, Type IV TA system n=1 Tax=Leucobacter ruminantium TaxID=1289170 RepID=A0A939LXU4_9MICO|nr:hypothetical protein [Leucobacter ruminantium]MBO1806441.1 hypothetical protein [Leucobacter ruminantium]
MDHAQHLDPSLAQLNAALIVRRCLIDGELDDRELRARTEAGLLVRVIRGCYLDRGLWDGLYEEQRLLARTLAVARAGRAGRGDEPQLVFSHLSAAVLWGLPLYGLKRSSPQRVHLLTPPERPGRSRGAVIRHSEPYGGDDVTTVAGLRVTTLDRTVRDLARLATPELALGCADRALRLILGGPHYTEMEPIERWRESQLRLLDERPGARGIRRAHRIIELADPRADSLAESVSRLQLVRLRVPFDFQVAVVGLNGKAYRMDFEFVGQSCFGEMEVVPRKVV